MEAPLAQIIITLKKDGNLEFTPNGGTPLQWYGMIEIAKGIIAQNLSAAPRNPSPLSLPKIDLSGLNGMHNPKG